MEVTDSVKLSDLRKKFECKEMGKGSSVLFAWAEVLRRAIPGSIQGFGERRFPVSVGGCKSEYSRYCFRNQMVEPLVCYGTGNAASGDIVTGGNIGLATE